MDLNKKRLIGLSAAAGTCVVLFIAVVGCKNPPSRTYFQSQPPEKTLRTWIGPGYWANPLQDWQLNNGRIECIQSGGDRNVFLLTRELTSGPGTLNMTVDLGRIAGENKKLDPGWPVTINQADNFNKTPAGYLPAIDVTGTKDPVIQVIDEETGQIVYNLRFEGTAFTPKVFKDGTYTLKVGDPPKIPFKTIKHLRPKKTPDMTDQYYLQFQ